MPFSPKLIRIVRRLILSLAVFATLIALAIVIENWRGNRAWKTTKERYAAKGDPLDVLPPPPPAVPDEQNFFCTPALANALTQREKPFGNTGPWHNATSAGHSLDLTEIAKRVAKDKKLPMPTKEDAHRILHDALAPIEPLLVELQKAALERPYSQVVRPKPLTVFNLFSDQNINFDRVMLLSRFLEIHACLMRAEQKQDIAYADILAGMKLAHGFLEESNTFLETLVGVAALSYAVQPLWEGCQDHSWTEAQLAEFQLQLGRCQPMKSMQRVLICERNAVFNINLNTLASDVVDRSPWWSQLPGWLQQNKASGTSGWDGFTEVISSHTTPQFRAELAGIKANPKKSRWNPYSQLAHIAQPNIGKLINDMIPDTNQFTLAATACALERHWLAHSSYPETLAELVPTYLDKVPLDIVNGDPLRYRRDDNGRFTLYSIGLDGNDDGGDLKKDWSWPQLAETQPAP